MKKQERVSKTLSTNIKDISAIGNELSDEQIRLVSGGKGKKRWKTGVRKCAGPTGMQQDVTWDY